MIVVLKVAIVTIASSHIVWFPALQDIAVCRIGCGTLPRGGTDSDRAPPSDPPLVESAAGAKGGFWSRVSFKGLGRPPTDPSPGASPSGSAATTPTEPQGGVGGCGRFGAVVSVGGCMTDVGVFTEPLLDTHVQALYRLGESHRQGVAI